MTSKLVLVTGANGFVGSALCRQLVARGHAVRGSVRSDGEGRGDEVDWRRTGDIGKATDWSGVLDGVDAVVHTAARAHVIRESSADPLAEFREVNVAGSARLARMAADAGVRRFVYLSSIGADVAVKAAAEGRLAQPYQISKWEAERSLAEISGETGMELVVVRPPLVYGPGARGNLPRLMRLIDLGVPLPLGAIRNRRSLIGLSNLCDLLCHCVTHRAAGGRTLAVADETLSTPALIRRLARALVRPVRLWPFPATMLRLGAALIGQSAAVSGLTESLELDAGPARALLDWSPIMPMDEELALTAAWWRERRR